MEERRKTERKGNTVKKPGNVDRYGDEPLEAIHLTKSLGHHESVTAIVPRSLIS